jgi:hypothetical protein
MPKKIYHLTIEHLYYLIQYDCYLTFKADGVFKSKNVYTGLIEYELLDDGRELIFDYITDFTQKNIIERMDEYCKLSNFEYPEFDTLTSDNFEEVINKYIDFYNTKSDRVLPKLYLKISNDSKLDIIKKINECFPMINYPTDGWVINPTDSNYSAKIKPLNQMTIDLKYKKNNFYDSNNNVYCIEGSRLKNNSIYRCYFNNNKWIAREERPDKKYPNSKNIIEIIQNQINFKMNLDTIDNSLIYNVYYSYNDNKISNDENIISSEKNKTALQDNIDILSHIKEYTSKWLSECKDNNVLDVGCGKSSSIINWKRIEPSNIVGLDIDPVCIFKSTILSNSNNYLWFNLNEDWDIRSQVGYFGKIWEATQLFKMNNLLKIFDYIVFNFSIHYTTNYDKLVKNLIARSRNGTILKFNWIDYKQISIFDIQIKDNQVSINLPWKENTHTEPYFDYNKFIDVLKKNNLNFINQTKITEFHTKYQNWQSNIYYDTWQFN